MTREEREKAIDLLDNLLGMIEDNQCNDYDFALKKGIDALKQAPSEDEDMGEVSDGYHTFNQLYHQRAILFATIVNQNKYIAWKSYKHSDGKYCFDKNGEWFVVGIDTPEGSYTYHYSKEYWDYFDCKELPCGKVWDGHTEKDVTRLLSLKQEQCEDVVSREKQETEVEQFARWVATEIFSDVWEFNKDAFAELACRKLAKLGIVEADGDEWELVDIKGKENS